MLDSRSETILANCTGIPYFILFRFIALQRYCIFYMKVCGNPAWSVYWCHFSNSICSLCLCHILVILAYFELFHYYICYGHLRSVISDITILIVLWHHGLLPYKMANLFDKCVCSHCSRDWLLPCPLLGLLFPKIQMLLHT